MSKLKFIIITIIILITAMLRLWQLDKFPNGFTGDEAQQGYSAYSILKTGKDEWGKIFPLFPRGFGDYKPPLYTYLTIPSIALFGLNPFAVRFPAALIGILSVVVIYFLTKELFKAEKIALWSTLLLTINPWHIQLSRTAWEGGIGILTFSLGLLFYLKSGMKNLILAAIFWGLTLYSYHSWRVFVILFIAALVLWQWKKLVILKNWIPAAILLLLTLPILFNLNSVLVRSSDVGIFSEQKLSGYFAEKAGSQINPVIDRTLDNKILFIGDKFLSNYLSYFSPTFYFTGERSDGTYLNFPYFPLGYSIELLFWITSIYLMVTKKIENKLILLIWFLLAVIPASLANGSANANRAPTLLPLTIIFSALGVNFLIEKFKRVKYYLLPILLFSFLIFLHFYFVTLSQKPPDNLRYGYDQVFRKVLEISPKYNQIVFSKVFTEPQIFVAFYSQMDPGEFQKASTDWLRYEKSNKLYVDQLESWNLEKYYFENINWNKKDSLRENALIISSPEDFPADVSSILDIKDPKGKLLYRLVPTKNAI